MISKEEFKTLVETVCFSKNMTQGELSKDMKYGENYISEMLSPTGKLTEKFVSLFKIKYRDILENPKQSEPIVEGLMLSLRELIANNKSLVDSQKTLAGTNQELVLMLKANSAQTGLASSPVPDSDTNKKKDPAVSLSGKIPPRSAGEELDKQKDTLTNSDN